MCASAVSRSRGAGAPDRASGGEDLGELPALVGDAEVVEAADRHVLDDDLGEGHEARLAGQLGPSDRVLCEIDLLVLRAMAVEDRLGVAAATARIGGVDGDLLHYFI